MTKELSIDNTLIANGYNQSDCKILAMQSAIFVHTQHAKELGAKVNFQPKRLIFFLLVLFQDIVGGQVHEFQVHHPDEAPLSYNLKIGNEAMQAPMVNQWAFFILTFKWYTLFLRLDSG